MAQRDKPASQPQQSGDPVAEAAEADILEAVGVFFADDSVRGAMECLSLLNAGLWPSDTRAMVGDLAGRFVSSRAQRTLVDLYAKTKAADKAKSEAKAARLKREAAEREEAAAAKRKEAADIADAEAKANAEEAKAAERAAAAKIGKAVR